MQKTNEMEAYVCAYVKKESDKAVVEVSKKTDLQEHQVTTIIEQMSASPDVNNTSCLKAASALVADCDTFLSEAHKAQCK